MISTARQAIERKIQNIVRKSLMDWPMDFGVETAVLNNVSGDYHEFGVFEGRSFIKNTLAFRKMLGAQDFNNMKFWAYDSFEGLPETTDKYAPAHFSKGAYSAPKELFIENVKKAGIGAAQLEVVSGFYDKSLTEDLARKTFKDHKIRMTYIDCDIYESCAPIFNFIAYGLQVGSIIVIDDWVRHHTHPNHGMQRAFHEWQQKYPNIKMNQIALSKRALFVVYNV